MGTQKKMGGDQAWYTVTDDDRGVVSEVEPRDEGRVAGAICWMLLNPEDPNDLPKDEFLAQAPGTPATKVKTKTMGSSFFMR
jgi:hypothetical protein